MIDGFNSSHIYLSGILKWNLFKYIPPSHYLSLYIDLDLYTYTDGIQLWQLIADI